MDKSRKNRRNLDIDIENLKMSKHPTRRNSFATIVEEKPIIEYNEG